MHQAGRWLFVEPTFTLVAETSNSQMQQNQSVTVIVKLTTLETRV